MRLICLPIVICILNSGLPVQADESTRPPGWMFFAPEAGEEEGPRLRLDLEDGDFVEHSMPDIQPVQIPAAIPSTSQPIQTESAEAPFSPNREQSVRIHSIPRPGTGEIFVVRNEEDLRYARAHDLREILFQGERYVLTEEGLYLRPGDIILEEVRRLRQREQDARYYVYPDGVSPQTEAPPAYGAYPYPPAFYPGYGAGQTGTGGRINTREQYRTSGGRRRGRLQRNPGTNPQPVPAAPGQPQYYYPIPPPPPLPPTASLNDAR